MDPTRVRFLGTGTAFNHDGRGSQSVWVEPARGAPFLVDAGPTLMSVLMREGIDCAPVERLFLTHLHGDHVAGWPFLMLHFVLLARRARPFEIIGPRGTAHTTQGLARLCYRETSEEQAFQVRYRELDVREATGIDAGPDLSFDVLPMRHHASSIGYRFHLGSASGARSVAVSGDTGWCENLERLADGTDLLILECSSSADELEGHLSLRQIRERIDRLRAKQVVLVHLTDEVAGRLAIDPLPRVTAAHDGMVLSLADDGSGPEA